LGKLSHDELFSKTHSLGDVISDLSEDGKFFVSVGGGGIISVLLAGAPGGLFFKKVLEFDSFTSVHLRFLLVLRDDVVVVNNLGLEGVTSLSKSVSLGGEVSKFFGPSGSFSVFPTGISGSDGGDLVLEGGQEVGDLSEKLWVLAGRSDLSEGVDKWSVSGEFVVKVGHVGESFGDRLDSTLELDEKSTSGEGSNKVDSILTSGDTHLVLSIELRPSGVLHVSLGLTGFDSTVDRGELSKGLVELLFSISKKGLGVDDSLVTLVGRRGMVISLVFVFWEKSIAGSSGFGVDGISSSLLVVELSDEGVDHTDNISEVVLTSRHVDRDLSEDSGSEWVSVNLSKSFHVLGLSHRETSGLSGDEDSDKADNGFHLV